MRAFDRYYEQFADGGIFADVSDLYADPTNLAYNHNEKNLIYLLYKNGYKNMGEIAEFFHLPKSTTSFVVNKLIDKEVLEIKRSDVDRRIKEVRLTGKGLKEASKIAENLNTRFERMVGNAVKALQEKITDEEMKTVEKAINIILG